MLIVPRPKELILGQDSCNIHQFNHYKSSIPSEDLDTECQKYFGYKTQSNSYELCLELDKMKEEEYTLDISPTLVQIKAGSAKGAFYALQTLKQIKELDHIPCLKIHDFTSLEVRGIMLDISRSKVASVSTIKHLIDEFSLLKINHLELYVEGFSYGYPSFPEVLEDKNYLTIQEIQEIEAYANIHFIDLVPNENGFGHMTEWLKRPEYQELKECPEGFTIWGSHRPSSTLDVTNPKSFELVKKMYEDMLPYFKSKYFNMNFDEPYELGHGKSAELCQKIGEGRAYVNYFNQLASVVKGLGKTPFLWGDFLIRHPEELPNLDKDAMFIDWGYDRVYDFESHAKLLEQANVKFLCAPGTSTWSVVTCRFKDMQQSILHSSESARNHHALGLITTDWGDFGHLQYLPYSYLGFIDGAIASWDQENILDARRYLYTRLGPLADIIYDLSNYVELEGEYRSYGSRLFAPIQWAESAMLQPHPIEFYQSKISGYLIGEKEKQDLQDLFTSSKTKLQDLPDTLEKKEVETSIYLLETLLQLQNEFQKREQGLKGDFSLILNRLDSFKVLHKALWDARNIPAGYAKSSMRIDWLKEILNGLQ
jgi:hexosaminidase